MKLSMKIKALILVILMVVGLFNSVIRASDHLTGEEIVESLKDSSSLISTGSATINMITENKRGQQNVNTLLIYRKDDGTVENQLIEYLEPADVKGTKFLSISDKNKDESEMWLYLPALGRERRIASHMTNDNFMGTDFTYEEIGKSKSYDEEYTAERLEDGKIDEYDCYVLKLIPKDEDGEYSQIKMWVWKDEMMPLAIEFYNLDDQLSKKLSMSNLEKQDDGEYLAKEIVMSNELSKTRTIIEIIEKKGQAIEDEIFTLRYLRR